MPELAQILGDVMGRTLTAIEESERAHLLAHVAAVKKLAGNAQPTTDDLQALYAGGWLPDFFAAAEVSVEAQLVLTTGRARTLDAKGGVTLGPLTLEAGFTNELRQATQTNMSVSVKLERQSRSDSLTYALNQLLVGAAPALPAGTAAAPAK